MKDIIRMNQLAGVITENQARKMMKVLNEEETSDAPETSGKKISRDDLIKKYLDGEQQAQNQIKSALAGKTVRFTPINWSTGEKMAPVEGVVEDAKFRITRGVYMIGIKFQGKNRYYDVDFPSGKGELPFLKGGFIEIL